MGDQSLFQASVLRAVGDQDGFGFAAPLILTAADFRFIVAEQMAEIGVQPGAIIIEPEPRNTAPAVLAAALSVAQNNPDGILLVVPSDHVIPDVDAFHAAIAQGLEAVKDGQLVTFGIQPDRPETGYGYLKLTDTLDGSGKAVALEQFVEKPDLATAEKMLAGGDHLWNAGIFLFAAQDILTAFGAHAPVLMPPVKDAVEQAAEDLDFVRLAPGPWSGAEDISIDYAVMEKAANISVVPFTGAWSDLGSWEAVLKESGPDAAGVATGGEALAIDCENTLLRSESSELELVGLGLKDVIAIATPDAVLVADQSRAQDVKTVVQALKLKGAKQATAFPMDHRPWGHFETLVLGSRFQVKRIFVKPGASLSLQSHFHRSEHWIVVSGTAKITVGDTVQLLTENQSVYVPLGAKHRLENPGKVPMILIEVQTGTYLGEDDIVRYEDVYSRGQGAKG